MSKDDISPEDKLLFLQAVKAVRPLKKIKTIVATPKPPTISPRQRKPAEPIAFEKKTPMHLSNYYTEEVSAESLLSFCRHSIPKKRFSELKHGRIQWDSRLDLHGLRPEAAQLTLINYILHEESLNHRCLLIIHGKGSKCGEAPVLKNLVNHWLRQIPQVLAFHSALPKAGGSGAMYVLLKRNRDI